MPWDPVYLGLVLENLIYTFELLYLAYIELSIEKSRVINQPIHVTVIETPSLQFKVAYSRTSCPTIGTYFVYQGCSDSLGSPSMTPSVHHQDQSVSTRDSIFEVASKTASSNLQ